MHAPQTILRTPRLVLRELRDADLDFIAGLVADPQVMRHWPHRLSRDEAAEWIRRQQAGYARDGHAYWLALDRRTGAPVGQAGLLMSTVEGVDEPGLGYMLHPAFWGRGLAVEAAAATLRWAGEAAGYRRVICLVQPVNVPSLRVALRLGLLPERLVDYKGLMHFLLARP